MIDNADDLTIHYVENDVAVIKELDKVILTKGAWATVIFKYQDWQAPNKKYSGIKFSIRRYQKRNGQYQQKSKFNISSEKQARQLIDTLQNWLNNG